MIYLISLFGMIVRLPLVGVLGERDRRSSDMLQRPPPDTAPSPVHDRRAGLWSLYPGSLHQEG